MMRDEIFGGLNVRIWDAWSRLPAPGQVMLLDGCGEGVANHQQTQPTRDEECLLMSVTVVRCPDLLVD